MSPSPSTPPAPENQNLFAAALSSAMGSLLGAPRVTAEARVVASDVPFTRSIVENSRDAACVFLGFDPPTPEKMLQWHDLYSGLLQDLPTTLIVNSSGCADMLA